MIMSIRNFLSRRTHREDGEIVETVLIVPFVVFLLFAFINMSMYFQARGTVQNIGRDGARQVALYGGSLSTVPRNNSGQDVTQTVFNKLYSSGHCTISGCSRPPRVTCTPAQATAAGQDVSCTIIYYFSPVANDYFGFAAITAQPFTIQEHFISETGY